MGPRAGLPKAIAAFARVALDLPGDRPKSPTARSSLGQSVTYSVFKGFWRLSGEESLPTQYDWVEPWDSGSREPASQPNGGGGQGRIVLAGYEHGPPDSPVPDLRDPFRTSVVIDLKCRPELPLQRPSSAGDSYIHRKFFRSLPLRSPPSTALRLRPPSRPYLIHPSGLSSASSRAVYRFRVRAFDVRTSSTEHTWQLVGGRIFSDGDTSTKTANSHLAYPIPVVRAVFISHVIREFKLAQRYFIEAPEISRIVDNEHLCIIEYANLPCRDRSKTALIC